MQITAIILTMAIAITFLNGKTTNKPDDIYEKILKKSEEIKQKSLVKPSFLFFLFI